MNCLEAEPFVSALYDGEQVPAGAVTHITACANCRRVLNDYSKMGAEMRLAAAAELAPLKSLRLPKPTNLFQFLLTRVAIPRFALAALITCLVLVTAATSLMRAQTRPLWFEFAYGPTTPLLGIHMIAQNGFDDTGAGMWVPHGVSITASVRIQIQNITEDDVTLRIRAVQAGLEPNGKGYTLTPVKSKLSLDGIAVVHYRPGDTLNIPIEGGGTLYLQGRVFDHQPKVAFGQPLEVPADQMIVRSAALVAGDQALGSLQGATAITQPGGGGVIRFHVGSEGTFLFGLKPFPGAVEGQTEWGQITFELDGREYRLLAAAPITGGDQPRPVWVRHDPQTEDDSPTSSIGAGRLPN